MKYCEAFNSFQICARRRSRRKCPEWPFVPPKLSWSLDHFDKGSLRRSKWSRSWGKKRRRSAKWPSGATSLDHFVEQNHHFVRISSNSNLSGTQTRRNERAHNLKTHLTTSQLVTNLQSYPIFANESAWGLLSPMHSRWDIYQFRRRGDGELMTRVPINRGLVCWIDDGDRLS